MNLVYFLQFLLLRAHSGAATSQITHEQLWASVRALETTRNRKNAVTAVPNDIIHGIRHVESARPVHSMCLSRDDRLLNWPKLTDVTTFPEAVISVATTSGEGLLNTRVHDHEVHGSKKHILPGFTTARKHAGSVVKKSKNSHISDPVSFQTEKERLEAAEHQAASTIFETMISTFSKKPSKTSTTPLVVRKRLSVIAIPPARTAMAQPIRRGSAFGLPPPPTKKPSIVTGKRRGDTLAMDIIGSSGGSYTDQLMHAMYADFGVVAPPPPQLHAKVGNSSAVDVLATQTPQPIQRTRSGSLYDPTARNWVSREDVASVGTGRVYVPESPMLSTAPRDRIRISREDVASVGTGRVYVPESPMLSTAPREFDVLIDGLNKVNRVFVGEAPSSGRTRGRSVPVHTMPRPLSSRTLAYSIH